MYVCMYGWMDAFSLPRTKAARKGTGPLPHTTAGQLMAKEECPLRQALLNARTVYGTYLYSSRSQREQNVLLENSIDWYLYKVVFKGHCFDNDLIELLFLFLHMT